MEHIKDQTLTINFKQLNYKLQKHIYTVIKMNQQALGYKVGKLTNLAPISKINVKLASFERCAVLTFFKSMIKFIKIT